jgi:hypothetical protein
MLPRACDTRVPARAYRRRCGRRALTCVADRGGAARTGVRGDDREDRRSRRPRTAGASGAPGRAPSRADQGMDLPVLLCLLGTQSRNGPRPIGTLAGSGGLPSGGLPGALDATCGWEAPLAPHPMCPSRSARAGLRAAGRRSPDDHRVGPGTGRACALTRGQKASPRPTGQRGRRSGSRRSVHLVGLAGLAPLHHPRAPGPCRPGGPTRAVAAEAAAAEQATATAQQASSRGAPLPPRPRGPSASRSRCPQSVGRCWSLWRRAHQAVAVRGHAVKRAQRLRPREAMRPPARPQARPPVDPCTRSTAPATVAPASVHRPLTETEWQRMLPLLPAQRPPLGRPRHDHRTVVTGILSVLGSGASWREMPREYGTWETASRRYHLWQDEGR